MESLPFLEDIYPQNLLYAVTIRSPIAKGSILSFQIPELPNNYTLITAKDIPGENRLEDSKIPILADKTLSYIGEPVAILLGPDKTKLTELSAKCKITVNEEVPVFSCDTSENSQLDATREIIIGNPIEYSDKLNETADTKSKVITGSYTTGIQEHWYAEPVGAVTWYKDDSSSARLIVKTATQWPYHVKRSVTRVLGIEPSVVSVEPTALNLHMDGKLWYPSLIACHAALGTFISKKPVRLILNREEDFLYTTKRCGSEINISSQIDENGNIQSTNIDINVNLGAYGVNENEILDQICLGSLGLYKFSNLKLSAGVSITNIPTQGPFSGFGLALGLFAIERHVSNIAESVKEDPAIWRENRVDPGLLLPSLPVKNNTNNNDLLRAVVKMSDYYRKRASFELIRQSRKGKLPDKGDNPRGIGIAVGFQGNNLLYHGEDNGVYSVEVTLTKDHNLIIKTSIITCEDYTRIWEKIASDIFSIEPLTIQIISVDSPDCGPSCSSRNITAITKLVEKCCLAIRKQKEQDSLPITVRRSFKPQSGSLRDGVFTPPKGRVLDVSGFLKPGLAAAVVEVSIDLIECIPVIRGVWLAVDGGKIISHNRAKRNLTRGAALALGWAFTENIEYINGVIPKTQYDNFTIFSPMDIPPIHIDFLENPAEAKDNEIKGIGDLPFTCIPAAFIQAVSQAMDHCFNSIPLKRKDIWEITRSKYAEAGHK
ncbi:MAG: molybdopterin-dependent oxidoreductase [Treponema sp.]|nr:molybdopterin-dependent oxidoreductase [Treponema sp.]